MGQRERRRQTEDDRIAQRYERGRQRDEEARAALVPLAPGERPRWVTISAAVAVLLAVSNTVAALAGADLAEGAGVQVAYTAILLLCAAGMWFVRYWAVMGFQTILVFQILALSLAVLRVEKWWVAAIIVAFIGLFGTLFWKLIRAMARIQMPAR